MATPFGGSPRRKESMSNTIRDMYQSLAASPLFDSDDRRAVAAAIVRRLPSDRVIAERLRFLREWEDQLSFTKEYPELAQHFTKKHHVLVTAVAASAAAPSASASAAASAAAPGAPRGGTSGTSDPPATGPATGLATSPATSPATPKGGGGPPEKESEEDGGTSAAAAAAEASGQEAPAAAS